MNPHHYAGTFRGQESDGGSIEYAKAVIAEAAELEVSVLAVTDHNSVSAIHEFRAAAEGHEITVFPGFEIASNEGIHILCITTHQTLRRKRSNGTSASSGYAVQNPPPICPANRSNRFSRK